MNKDEFPRPGASGSGTEHCYSVEARINYPEPKEINGTIYHKEWKTIRFDVANTPVGVPVGVMSDAAKNLGLLSYPAAQTLRWWFHALCKYEFCLETRIVKHIVKHSYEEQIVGAHELIGMEDRSAIMPDWKN